jgi:hypothetical protein
MEKAAQDDLRDLRLVNRDGSPIRRRQEYSMVQTNAGNHSSLIDHYHDPVMEDELYRAESSTS